MPSQTGYYRHPTIHGDAVVFVCEDDLWTVSSEGGIARRLTSNPGSVSFPTLSPDGSKIAFTGKDEGPLDVYVVDLDGGPARRLTWLGGYTYPVGWSPDGSEVILASDWRQAFRGYYHLYGVPAAGGVLRPLSCGPAKALSYQRDGRGVVIGRNSGDPARWKRYRGGTAGTIWIDRRGDGSFSQLVRLAGNVASPMWIGSRIYFLSDHEGYGNLYSCTPAGRDLRRQTDHEDYYVRFPSTDGRRIVYHAGADLHIFDPRRGISRKLDVRVASPRPQRNRKFVPAARCLEGVDLHPKGHSVLTVHRGLLHAMGLWEGGVSALGGGQGVRLRLGRWLSDGRRAVAVSDEGGEEGLVVLAADGGEKPRRLTGDFGRATDLVPSPAGPDRVALTNQRQELILIDLMSGRSHIVERSAHGRIDGVSWAPDGRWIAYGFPDARRTSRIHLLEIATGKVTAITRPGFRDGRPAFDPGGRFLYFISWRVFDPVPDGQYFDYGFPKGSLPCLLTLRRDLSSPFSLAAALPRAPGAPAPQDPRKEGGKKRGREGEAPAPIAIDLEGIEDRVVAFPVPEARYGKVLGGHSRVLFSSYPIEGVLDQSWLEMGEPPAKGRLEAYDLDAMKTEAVHERMTDFTLSLDGKTLGIRSGNRVRAVPIGFKTEQKSGNDAPGRESGWLDMDRVRVSVVPGEEWRQMFREAWRLQRDQFWTPEMSGIDWKGVHDRYLPLVDRAASRSEFSDLLWEMQGELGTSHCYEMGGDYRPEPSWFQGILGADLELDERRGVWSIARIPRGDSWDEKRGSPLAAPGLCLSPGDEILAVGGRPVNREVSPYERLVNMAGQDVRLTVRSKGSRARGARKDEKAGGGAGQIRTITVRALRDESALRYRDWVERKRAWVHAESKGRIGYIHIPDMGGGGFSEFHRYYQSEVDREGLIVDVRWNGGGHVSQLLLTKLLLRRIGYDASRWGEPEPYPTDAPMGPMVALTNEYAGSDGDIFSHAFKLYKLGPLIGKRTWGGVVGIWPRHSLVDGTFTSQPEFAFWFEDVGWGVENYGTDPDIEVEMAPQEHAAGRDTQLARGFVEITRRLRRKAPKIPPLDRRPSNAPGGLPTRQ
ncbi:MAG: peptidase [Candidatus Eisenbacteria bacterium]|nr:peptidase [Candidatus Eisenbacteria bacterium]